MAYWNHDGKTMHALAGSQAVARLNEHLSRKEPERNRSSLSVKHHRETTGREPETRKSIV
ncbi:hypothetical protein PISMIDRAFT_680145 [Pisolithus microcarpus 441]|uniref:Uncharacterized protein n=1 Tax=Pisolithus microcarpus 441 TaxID=765257 RepID=A0A0C9YCP8_9AGAM|nr:hypothetical protein PISMIDRAFT_680145 [Pisolithus microcarpus 441]